MLLVEIGYTYSLAAKESKGCGYSTQYDYSASADTHARTPRARGQPIDTSCHTTFQHVECGEHPNQNRAAYIPVSLVLFLVALVEVDIWTERIS